MCPADAEALSVDSLVDIRVITSHSYSTSSHLFTKAAKNSHIHVVQMPLVDKQMCTEILTPDEYYDMIRKYIII